VGNNNTGKKARHRKSAGIDPGSNQNILYECHGSSAFPFRFLDFKGSRIFGEKRKTRAHKIATMALRPSFQTIFFPSL
jgi:hypothetical protein